MRAPQPAFDPPPGAPTPGPPTKRRFRKERPPRRSAIGSAFGRRQRAGSFACACGCLPGPCRKVWPDRTPPIRLCPRSRPDPALRGRRDRDGSNRCAPPSGALPVPALPAPSKRRPRSGRGRTRGGASRGRGASGRPRTERSASDADPPSGRPASTRREKGASRRNPTRPSWKRSFHASKFVCGARRPSSPDSPIRIVPAG